MKAATAYAVFVVLTVAACAGFAVAVANTPGDACGPDAFLVEVNGTWRCAP